MLRNMRLRSQIVENMSSMMLRGNLMGHTNLLIIFRNRFLRKTIVVNIYRINMIDRSLKKNLILIDWIIGLRPGPKSMTILIILSRICLMSRNNRK